MPTKNFVADAIELVMKAWEGDRLSFERLSIASRHLGSSLLESELLELKIHSQLLENLAWGLKELDAEHHEGKVTHNYVALALATAMRAYEGNQQSFDRLSQAAERFGYKLTAHNLLELKAHSQHLENIAWGLKEMESVHL